MTKHKVWAQVGRLMVEVAVLVLSGAAIFIVISRAAGAEMLGKYSLVMAWTLVFQSAGTLGVAELVMREVGRSDDALAGKYVGHGFVISICASLIGSVIMAILVGVSGYQNDVHGAMILGALTLPCAAVMRICRSGFIARGGANKALVVKVFEFLVVVPLTIGLVLTGHGVRALLATLLAGKVLGCLVSIWLLHSQTFRIALVVEFAFIRELLPSVSKFALSELLGILSKNLNPIMLGFWLPVAVVGHYSAAYKLIELVMVVPFVFTEVMLPRLARDSLLKDAPWVEHFEDAVRVLYAVMVAGVVGVFVFAEPIMLLIFGPEFGDSVPILRVLLVLTLVICVDINMATLLKATGWVGKDVQLFSINPLTNSLLNIGLIPAFGPTGAALAALLAGLASLVLRGSFVAANVAMLGWRKLTLAPFGFMLLIGSTAVMVRNVIPIYVLAPIYFIVSLLFVARVSRVSMSTLRASWRGFRGDITAPE